MQNYIILIEYLYIQNQTGIHVLLFALLWADIVRQNLNSDSDDNNKYSIYLDLECGFNF